MPTSEQKSSRLFKKSLGIAETLVARQYFEEPKFGSSTVLPTQIWSQADSIQPTAPSLAPGGIEGVVQYWEKLSLDHVDGAQNLSYYHESLKDAINFTFDATYNFLLYKSNNNPIYDGVGDWIVDVDAGVLTFYGTLPGGVSSILTPQITFYKYVGSKGLSSGATSSVGNITVKDPVSAASTVSAGDITGYTAVTSGFSYVPTIDGYSPTNGERILLKNQDDDVENGIFEVSTGTLIRPSDADGSSGGTVSINDYVFVLSGDTQTASSWIISVTTAIDSTDIDISFETQEWKLFATGSQYTADENGLKLIGNQFSIELDENGGYGSGLIQGVDGLKMTDPNLDLLNSVTGLTSDIVNVSGSTTTNTNNILSNDADITALSGWTGDLASDIVSNDVDIAALSGWTGTINTQVGTNTTNITSNDADITALSGWTGNLVTDIVTVSGSTTTNTNNILSNDEDITALSGWTGDLSTDIVALSGWSSVLAASIVTNVNNISSNTGAINTNISSISNLSGWTGTIEARVTVNESDILELSGATIDLSGAAGSGLTYTVGDEKLNVVTDDWTIKITANSGLTTPIIWTQTEGSVNISGVAGTTEITLSYDPVGYVSAYVNGIEYLINPGATDSTTNMPFYFDAVPPVQGSELWFNPLEAGFDIVSTVDFIVIKYHYLMDL